VFCLLSVSLRVRMRVAGPHPSGKTIIRAEKEDSFFHFFYDPQVTTIGEEEDEEEVYQHIDADFELGLTFKDKVSRSTDFPACTLRSPRRIGPLLAEAPSCTDTCVSHAQLDGTSHAACCGTCVAFRVCPTLARTHPAQLIPNAFRWYTGEACDSEDDEAVIGDEPDSDDESKLDEDDEEEEDSEADYAASAAAAAAGGGEGKDEEEGQSATLAAMANAMAGKKRPKKRGSVRRSRTAGPVEERCVCPV
jgi:hypothetical protein